MGFDQVLRLSLDWGKTARICAKRQQLNVPCVESSMQKTDANPILKFGVLKLPRSNLE